MAYNNKNIYLELSLTALCMLVAFWLHTLAFINWDLAWHVEGAKRLLGGGSYLLNLFDNNSPFVFAYFFPVVVIHELFPLSYPPLIIAYITLTALIPLILSRILINRTYPNEIITQRLLYFTLIYLFLFLPAFNYGHREMALMYFYLPYFFLIMFATYLQRVPIGQLLAYVIAILGAYGILQNIFYLCIPLFLDLYRYLKCKTFNGFQLFFYICILVGILSVSLLYPEYIKHIIPMVLCYESGFNFPILVLLLEIFSFLSLLTLTVVLINFKRLYKSDDIVMCFIAAVCALLIYFLELKLWYYHFYPALCFVILILILFIAKYYEETQLGTVIIPKVNLTTVCLATGILVTIFMTVFGFYRTEIAIYKDPTDLNNKWLTFVKANFENKKLYFLVIPLGQAYSLPFYSSANVKVTSPWSNPWMLPYIIKHERNDNGFLCDLKKDIKIFQAVATNALLRYKPDYIITEDPPLTLLFRGRQFNYFTFFSENKAFAKLIKNYTLFGKFKKFTIYKRINLER